MTELLNYLNEINELKNKLVVNLNAMGVRAEVSEPFIDLVDKVLLVSIDDPETSYLQIVDRVTEQDEILVQAQAIVDSINCKD